MSTEPSSLYPILEMLVEALRKPWTDQEIAELRRIGEEILHGPSLGSSEKPSASVTLDTIPTVGSD